MSTNKYCTSDVLILVMSYLLRGVTYLYATMLLFSSVCTFELKHLQMLR